MQVINSGEQTNSLLLDQSKRESLTTATTAQVSHNEDK